MKPRQSLRKATTALILAWLVLHLAGLPNALAGAVTGQPNTPANSRTVAPTQEWAIAQTTARPPETLLAANAGITTQKPQVRVSEEADLPKSAEEEGWFSRYKWWLLAGLVIIAGGAAAAGGGGGSDSSGGSSTSGGVDVTW